MSVSVGNILSKSMENLGENFSLTMDGHGETYADMLHYLEILNIWEEKLNVFDQNILLKEVCYDLLSSLYISAQGMYRNAYICLRSALELGLSFIYFVDRNYEYMLWQKNDYDMKWATLKDAEKGLLNKRYFKLFLDNPNLEELIVKVQDVYRECSEYVHGKYAYLHTISNQKILYESEKIDSWSNMFIQIVEVINVFLCIRFKDTAREFPEDKKITLKEILIKFKLGEIL
ncbi:Putative uncharacterized protein [Bacillus mycoides]|nr:Putative uncharacterized protein [Bacillus mycoides]